MQFEKPPAHTIDMRSLLLEALQKASQPKKKAKDRKKQAKEEKKKNKKRLEEQKRALMANRSQAVPAEGKKTSKKRSKDKPVRQEKPLEKNQPAEQERLDEQNQPAEEEKQSDKVQLIDEVVIIDDDDDEEDQTAQEKDTEPEIEIIQEKPAERGKSVELKLFLPRFSCVHGSDMNCVQCKAKETNMEPPTDPKNDRIVFVVPSELDPILGKATVCQRAVFRNSSSPGCYLQLPSEIYKVVPVTPEDHVKRTANCGEKNSHFFLRLGASYFKATPVPWEEDDDDSETDTETSDELDPQNQQGNKRSLSDLQNGTSNKRRRHGRKSRSAKKRCQREFARIIEPLYVNIKTKRFRIMDVLGYGVSSVLCRGLETKERKMYALKCGLLADPMEPMEVGEALLNEVEILKHLRSCPRAVTMYNYQEFSPVQSLFIQLEMGDVDLSRLMQSVDDLNMHDILYFWDEMLTAVNEVHKYGVIHGDLKPSNFVFFRGVLKLTDFGLSYRTILPWEKIHRKRNLAAVNYMSPETAKHHLTSFKSDVWSLGCILYEILYKVTPFEYLEDYADKITAISSKEIAIQYPYRADCPRALTDILHQCLTRDEAARPSVEEIINYPWQ